MRGAAGRNVREVLKLIPAKAVIERHVQYVYGCRACEKQACTVPIVKAKAAPPLIKGTIASAEAVAHIMTQKFVMGVPLYRQEQGGGTEAEFLFPGRRCPTGCSNARRIGR